MVQVGLAGKLVDAARISEKWGHFRPRPERGVLVDHGAVGPEVAAGGIEANEIQVVFQALARAGEEFAQDMRHGQQRGPHVPAEAIDVECLDLAARLPVFLPDLDRVAGMRQADGRGEPAQPGAD